jgi:hypothetical protein
MMRVPRSPNSRSRKSLAALAGGALTLGMVAAGAAGAAGTAAAARPVAAGHSSPSPSHSSASTCVLGGGAVKHVIYLQFDNVHYTRDNPNVPSDLEQMPNLLNFIRGNGTLISHEHTPLIAHTADDIVTSETGLYGSHTGVPIANEYNYYTGMNGDSSDPAGSFAYWTDPIVDYSSSADYAGTPTNDSTPTMVTQNGKMAPAPWVPYTRDGCDFGSVAAANTEIENPAPDVADIFGPNSADAAEGNNPSDSTKADADYEGLSVHCAKGSAVCASHHSVADLLPDEPGGYHGYRALFGARYIDSVLSPRGPVRNLNGQVIKDFAGNVGFPGYDSMQAYNALAYTLDMQTHGVPVTFTYLTDLHDSWIYPGPGMGPGEEQYERQLRSENAAFGTFFAGLAAHGITKANTLFVITSDEGDHFVGGAPSPANCDGVHVACTYKNAGEVDGNITGMLAARGITTPFDVSADSAPIIYVHGQPGRTDSSVRALERTAATVTADDVATGKTVKLVNYMADPVEMKLLHMVTGDPKRTATVAVFANPDFWLDSSVPQSCGNVLTCEPSGGDAWNHGDVAPQINTTWLGLVGPGVRHQGVNNALWSDHTDIQPTMMALLRLHDDYTPDGRVLIEVIKPAALPAAVRAHYALLVRLGVAYSQLNAAVGEFGLDTLKASTLALASDSPGDAAYTRIENALIRLGNDRDAVVSAISGELYGAEFGHGPRAGTLGGAGARQSAGLIQAGERLLTRAAALG